MKATREKIDPSDIELKDTVVTISRVSASSVSLR